MNGARKTVLAAGVVLAVAMAAGAGDWAQFRGPNRDGQSPEKGLLKAWPKEGPQLLWSAKGLGEGFSQAAVAGGRVYTTGLVGEKGRLRAFDLDGKVLWSVDYGSEWAKGHPGARSTPTVHDGLIYLTSGTGTLACFDAKDGRKVWSDDILARYGGRKIVWGYAENVLVDGENVIVFPCGTKATAVAFDRKTGKEVWATKDLGAGYGYGSPVLIEHAGVRMVVAMTKAGLVAVSPKDGTILWEHAYANGRGNHPVMPLYSEGMLYVTSGYGKGAVGLKFASDGKSVTQVWAERKQDTVHGNVVLVDGVVYGSTHQNAGGKWVALDFRTGKVLWVEEGAGKGGSIVAADGMLYCYSEEGVVALVKPSREKCEVVSSFKVPQGSGSHWAHPTVAGGRLYIRHGDALMCYGIAAAGK